MSTKPVRTRFAPSPTGSLHIGGLRTALFNWLFARHHGGQFLLRIEDTDQKRFDPNALQTLIEAMKWSGLNWDEGPDIGGPYGPYVQSERLALYQKWANWLVDQGKAYKCFCTSERLERVNKEKQARKEPPGYDRHCRYLTPEQVAEQESQGLKYVIRFKMPLEGQTVIPDLIRGDVVFENVVQQDAVILKSDGFPTYHLAHVVDDHFMEISHVMRAVEWLPSAPLHMNLWYAFEWERPYYAHLPVMLNPNGKGKMSKRNPPVDKFGNIIPVMVHDYMQRGYLPEAMNNFLANIGWSIGDDREIFSMADAIERFDMTHINEANSAFPVEKLDWVNGEHLRHLDPQELAKRLRPFLEAADLEVNVETLLQIIPLVQTRLKTLKEIVDLAGFFFKDYSAFSAPAPEMLIQKKMDSVRTLTILNESIALIEQMDSMAHEPMHEAFKALAERLGVGNGPLFGTLRVALTAQTISTPTFETMEVLGKAESLRRLRMAVARLTEQHPNPSPQE
jgi:glutamyl-tRNA synthetase